MARQPASAQTVMLWIRDYPEIVFNGINLTCTLCNVPFSCTHNNILKKHVASKKHQSLLCGGDKQRQLNIDLVKFMVGCNIPWAQLDNPIMRDFIVNCIGGQYAAVQLPSSSTLRKVYLPQVAESIICQIRSELEGKRIWLCVDDMNNPNSKCGDKIANVLVGAMVETKATRGHLLASRVLEQTSAYTVSTLVSDSLRRLWGNNYESSKDKLLLFITDTSDYMKLAGRMVQETFSNCVHLTCIARALHHVAETIRESYPRVDTLIMSVKEVFRKAPERERLFCELFPTTEMPPEPIATRCGTWIEAAIYYARHLEEVKLVLQQLASSNQALEVARALEAIMDPTIERSLQEIDNYFSKIPSAIQQLEQNPQVGNFLKLIDQMKTIYDLQRNIEPLEGDVAEKVKLKLEAVLEANPGFRTLNSVVKLLQDEEIDFAAPGSHKSTLKEYPYFRYAPITSVDIEHSFSMYKWIFSDQRRRLTPSHMEQILRIYFYYSTGEPPNPE